MNIREIIDGQRETYLKQLTKFYSERATGAKEILLELDGDEKERTFKLYRLDYYEEFDGQGKPTELGADTLSRPDLGLHELTCKQDDKIRKNSSGTRGYHCRVFAGRYDLS
jgi:hypothetical protein